MKILRFIGKLGCWLALCVGLAGADSIQLRNGRHLQGKYIGGTTTAVGFMTGGTVEYFATSEVLVLMFENANDSPLSELNPSPMRGKSESKARARRVQRINGSTPNMVRQLRSRRVVSSANSDVKLVLTASP